jgi:hypothetical protein
MIFVISFEMKGFSELHGFVDLSVLSQMLEYI